MGAMWLDVKVGSPYSNNIYWFPCLPLKTAVHCTYKRIRSHLTVPKKKMDFMLSIKGYNAPKTSFLVTQSRQR